MEFFLPVYLVYINLCEQSHERYHIEPLVAIYLRLKSLSCTTNEAIRLLSTL